VRLLFVFALVFLAIGAAAQRVEPSTLPPPRARSVEVVHADAPVFLAPRRGAKRRGTLALGARFPALRRVAGSGCSVGVWVEIAHGVFVCENDVRYSARPPEARPQPDMEGRSLLPHDYAFVATDGTRAFAHPSDYFTDEYFEALGEGFGLILTGSTVYDGVPFVRTRRRLWIEADQVRRARGSEFAGVELSEGETVAFVRRRGAPVYDRRGGRVVRRAGHRSAHVVGEGARGWVALSGGGWMRERDLALARPRPRPQGVLEGGTWIEVDVDHQLLVAYRGDRPVYATLVSTGRRGPHHETPRGLHRIWVKLAYSDMDNLERDDLERNYAIEGVPWVQYFEGSNGLHAAFWHDDFGRRKSHGCVNLSPRDARALYEFTEPAMPPGWTAIFPREDEAATYVWVH